MTNQAEMPSDGDAMMAVECSTRFQVIGTTPGVSEPLVMLQIVGGTASIMLPASLFAQVQYVPEDGDTFDLDYRLFVKQVPDPADTGPAFGAVELVALRHRRPAMEIARVPAR